MKHIFLIFLIFSSFFVFSQKNRSIHVGISEGVHINPNFSKTDFQMGIEFELESSSINAFGIYQLYGNIKEQDFPNFLFASHLLGVGAEHRTTIDKRVSLFIGANLLTEVATNFENGYLSQSTPSYPRIDKSNEIYLSTPLASSVYLGADFKVIENLHINLSVENNFRIMRVKHLTLNTSDFEDYTFEELINNQEVKIEFLDKLGLRLGLKYNFSLKK